MGMSLAGLRRVACDGQVPLELLRPMLPFLLAALDFLHSKANMVHAGGFYIYLTDKSIEHRDVARS